MAKGAGDKPASRGIVSTLGTLTLAILLLGFGFWAGRTFEALWPSQPAATPPPTVAQVTPPPTTVATPEPSPSASPSLEPSPEPSPSEPAASAARRGAPHRVAPSPAPATAAAPAATPPPAPMRPGRPFVLGKTVVESLKPATSEVPGFDTAGLGVKRAPEVPGRVDFEVNPSAVKAGDAYAVKVYLVNDGGKAIAVDALSVAMVADGKRSARAMPPRARNVAPKERALLAELPGVWQDGLGTWALEVAVTSKRQDRYTNTLNWK